VSDDIDPSQFPGFDPAAFTSFAQIQKEVEEFSRILSGLGINILHGSPLENMCLTLLGLEEQRNNAALVNPMEDIRIFMRPALGLHDLLRRIIRLQSKPDFPKLIPHLRLLNSSSIAQNVTAATDTVAAKIFELLMGLVCLEIGTNLELDGPIEAFGDNPDILVTLDGRRWGFACKVLYGVSPITMFDRLEEGVRQIDRSPAEVGCTIINLKNQIKHDETWPLTNPTEYARGVETPTFGAWRSIEYPRDILRTLAGRRHEELVSVNGEPAIQCLFGESKSIPGALLFLQTATALASPARPVNSTIGIFNLMRLGEISSAVSATLDRLNEAMHHRRACNSG
jgi:hypothetical protein